MSQAALLLLMGALPLAAQTYTYSEITVPGASNVYINGRNNAGQIVGQLTDAAGTHGFLLTGTTLTSFDVPGAQAGTTMTWAINTAGVIGGSYNDGSGLNGQHCYLRSADGASFTKFDLPYDLSSGCAVTAVNDRGDAAGGYLVGPWSYGFVRTAAGATASFGYGSETRVTGIDNAGDVVGWFKSGGSYGPVHGFLRGADGTMTQFDLPGTDTYTQITGINNHGQIIGVSGPGFVRNLDGSFSAIAMPGSQTTPVAIDDNGRIAGGYTDSTGSHIFLATPGAASTQPEIRTAPAGVITALAFGGSTTLSPGNWIEIYGRNLASTTRAWTMADFTGATAPLSLDGVSVHIAGVPAFVYYVSPGQVNALVPAGVPPGPAAVTVTNGSQTSAPFTATVTASAPTLLALPHTSTLVAQYLVAVFPDFVTYVLPPYYPNVPTRRARAGDTIVLFGAGLGPVTPPVAAGQIAPQSSKMAVTPQVFFNDIPAQVTFAGLVQGSVGLYQINVVVPNVPVAVFDDQVKVYVKIGDVYLPSSTYYWLPVEK